MNSTKIYVFASGLLVYLPVGLFIKLRINVYQIFGDDRPCVREQLDFFMENSVCDLDLYPDTEICCHFHLFGKGAMLLCDVRNQILGSMYCNVEIHYR